MNRDAQPTGTGTGDGDRSKTRFSFASLAEKAELCLAYAMSSSPSLAGTAEGFGVYKIPNLHPTRFLASFGPRTSTPISYASITVSMKTNTAFVISLLGIGQAVAAVPGFDISHWQSSVDFAAAYKSGARFVMIKVSSTHQHVSPRPMPS